MRRSRDASSALLAPLSPARGAVEKGGHGLISAASLLLVVVHGRRPAVAGVYARGLGFLNGALGVGRVRRRFYGIVRSQTRGVPF